jgi:hypothetical protein
MAVAEIELTARNTQVIFPPLGQTRKESLRGEYDWREVPGAFEVHRTYGVIFGHRIGIDPDKGAGYVVEPIHAPEHNALKKRILEKWKLDDERREFRLQTPDRWLRCMVRLVQAGLARIVKGKLPDRVDPVIDPPTHEELAAACAYVSLTPEQQQQVDQKIIAMRLARR